MVSPIVAPPDPRGPRFEQTWICTMSGRFHVDFNISGLVVLKKKIFKHFSYINTCKNCFPYCGPTRPPGTMIWTNLNLLYVSKLPCKFELSWPCGSWEEDFQMNLTYFCIFVIISPLKRTWPFIWTILNFHHLRMICTKFEWNGPAGSGEEDF